MGRWILLLLVAANLVYCGWGWQQQAARVPAQPAVLTQYEGVPRLVLLTERSPQPRQQPSVSRPEPLSVEVPPGDLLCALVGPFSERVSARQVRGRLAALDITSVLRGFEVMVKTDYWVHLPPFPSRRQALQALRDLQGQKIDSFLITDGELENGISLGLFTRRESADKVAERRRKQGYEAKVREMPRTETELWLAIRPQAAARLGDEQLERLREGNNQLELRRLSCDDVARSNELE